MHLEKFIVQHIDYLPSVVGRPTSHMSNVQVVFHMDTACAFWTQTLRRTRNEGDDRQRG